MGHIQYLEQTGQYFLLFWCISIAFGALNPVFKESLQKSTKKKSKKLSFPPNVTKGMGEIMSK